MRDHLSIGDVEEYRGRKLPLEELVAMNEHLAGCLTCRELFDEPHQLEAAYGFARAVLRETQSESGAHLSYRQIESFADGLLSEEERSVVETHFDACRTCEEEAEDFRRIRGGEFSGGSTGRRESTRFPAVSRSSPRIGYGIGAQISIMIAIAAAASLLTVFLLRGSLGRQQALLNDVQKRGDELQRGLDESNRTVADLQAQLEHIREAPGELSSGGPEGLRIILNDAHGAVTLNSGGAVTGLEMVGPRDERSIREALTSGRVRTPASLSKLVGKPNQLMGTTPKDSFRLLSPVGTFVLSNQPALKWERLDGASGYQVTVLDSALNEIETSPLLTDTEWQVTRRLKPGGVYLWQVRALKDGSEIRSPSPDNGDAKFRVLDHSKAIELERLKQTYSNSHLALGVLYAEAGLLDEANQEFQALAEANPHSRIVRSLIASLKSHPAK